MDISRKLLLDKYQEHLAIADENAKKAASIKYVLDMFEDLLPEAKLPTKTDTPVINQDQAVFDFPYKSNKKEKALWILTRRFSKAVKLPEIQKEYTRITSDKSDIQMSVRVLKNEGKVAKQEYGNNNKTYWGLRDWHDGEDFKAEFKPDVIE